MPPSLRPGSQGIQEGSQTSRILGYLDEARQKGATLQDIYKRLAVAGITNEASIRSAVWNQKKLERIVLNGDRYYRASYAPTENGGQPEG